MKTPCLFFFQVLASALLTESLAVNNITDFRPPDDDFTSGGGTVVEVSQTCWEKHEEIVIRFRNGEIPHLDDWVGIYPSDYHATEEPLHWVQTCGALACDYPRNQGTVSVAAILLPPGRYKAVLARDGDGDDYYHVLANSTEFRVVRNLCTLPKDARHLQQQSTGASRTILNARNDIMALLRSDRELPGRFLRLVFHDCIGGRCDGCIQMNNHEHAGNDITMGALREIALRYRDDLTRADVWALAAFVSVEYMMPPADRIDFPFQHYGRVDCPGRDMTAGPDPPMCDPDFGTDMIIAWFQQNWRFTGDEIAAIMGAHTIGIMRQEVLGFDAPLGWVADNMSFDNQWHKELVGEGGNMGMAPLWTQRRIQNGGTNENPDRWQWEGFPDGRRVVMTNSDIAMIRQLDTNNLDSQGRVSCKFIDRAPGTAPRCQDVGSILLQPMIRYAADNRLFLRDFYRVMVKMTDIGYQVDDASCDASNVCRLVAR